jgi:glutamyl-Q tRNA(Asp) synthetase
MEKYLSATRIITRFAPSPTGPLHLGHAYSAVLVHDLARAAGGRFLVRVDDIDGSRSRPEYVDAAMRILEWLGLGWDGEPIFQSSHLDEYRAVLDQLKSMGLAYPCFCTRADIAQSLSAPHGPSGIIYPGTCRSLSANERARRMESEAYCWRLDMAQAVQQAGTLAWQEYGSGNAAGMGEHVADPLAHGDIVLARKDAPASYHLASCVDDARLGVTDIVRGADLRLSTDVHRLLQAVLGWSTPRYHHHGLICGADGRRLAKRDQAAALSIWKDAGMDGKVLAEQLRQSTLPAGYSLQQA